MNDTALKTAAYAIAEAAPRHLDQPTSPPIRWRKEGDDLVVILADGRIATGPIVDQYRDKVGSVKKQVEVPKTSPPANVVTPVPEGHVFPKGYEPPAGTKPLPVPKPPSPRGKKK